LMKQAQNFLNDDVLSIETIFWNPQKRKVLTDGIASDLFWGK
jgi:hypothetical protein